MPLGVYISDGAFIILSLSAKVASNLYTFLFPIPIPIPIPIPNYIPILIQLPIPIPIPIHTPNSAKVVIPGTAQSLDMVPDAVGVWMAHCHVNHRIHAGTVRVFRQKFTLKDAIGSHACSLEANTRVTNGIPLGSSLLLPVVAVHSVQTRKVWSQHTQLS
jgi:hypothetical protein